MRVTLLRREAEAGPGAELLHLCSTITEDGAITEDEIAQLRDWLDRNRSGSLPAITFLCDTVDRILADGRVTEQERSELHHAVERVLPKELRETSIARRRQKEVETYRTGLVNRPVISYDFMVAGVAYEGRARRVERYAYDNQPVYLLRDPDNRYSRHAVKVLLGSGQWVGFVPEEYARDLAPLLDSGYKQSAYITKILRGRSYPIPVVAAHVYRPECDNGIARTVNPEILPGLVNSTAVKPAPAGAGSGCSIAAGVATLLLLLVLAQC